jgi:hypothetical protein
MMRPTGMPHVSELTDESWGMTLLPQTIVSQNEEEPGLGMVSWCR